MQNKNPSPLDKASTESTQRETFVFEDKSTRMEFSSVDKSVRAQRDDEFSIPEEIAFDEKYNMPLPKEELPRIWHTYIPRFTGAADNLRSKEVKSAESPQSVPEHKKTVTVVEEISAPAQQKTAAARVVSPPASHDEAEFDSVDESVVVTVQSEAPKISEDVFVRTKPIADVESEPSVQLPRTLEDERDDVAKIMEPLPAVEEIAENSEIYNDPEPTAAPEVNEERIFYTIPDPVAPDEATPAPVPMEYHFPKEAPPAKVVRHHGEYLNFSQRDAIKDRFLDTILSVRIRFLAAFVLTLLLLVFENLGMFGVDALELLHLRPMSGGLALVDLEIVVALFALSLPEIVYAVRELCLGRVRSELLLVVGFIAQLLYCLLIAIDNPVSYPLFGFVYGALVLCAILSSSYYEDAKFASFRLISRGAEKQVLHTQLTRELAHENLALDGAVDEYKSKTARVFKTAFVPDFFKKHRSITENGDKMLIYICVSLSSALVVGLISYFVGDGMATALPAFACTTLFSLPIFTLFSHKLTYYHFQHAALSEESTVLGDGAIYDYAGVDVVTYEDTEIFGEEDVFLTRLELYGDDKNFSRPLRHMSALFSPLGGPLSVLFAKSLDRSVAPARDIVIESDGVSGTVGGVAVFAGSEEYMRRHHITIPEQEGARGDLHSTLKVMYAAEGDTVYCRFYFRYSFSEEFSMLLPSLREAGIVPLVYTRDPNISNELLSSLTLGGKIRVMKKYNLIADDLSSYSRLDAGLVTLRDKTAAINMLLLSKKYVRFQERMETLATLANVTGVVLAAALSLFVTPLLPSLFLGLWHGVWIAVIAIAAFGSFRYAKIKHKDKVHECQS